MSSARPLFVVAGLGNGSGTGAASARVFAKAGYRVALISRGPEHLSKLESEINQAGGEAKAFPVNDYTPSSIKSAFTSLKSQWPSSPLRVALFNAGHGVWKPFLDITEEEVRESIDTNVIAAFAFARETLLEFTKQDFEAESEGGVAGNTRKKGTLIFTGATAAIRGNTTTSAFAAGKFGIRALSQSLAKEFGKQNIHVAHSIIDGVIITDRVKSRRNDAEWEANQDVRLSPEAIANSYLYLVKQDSSALTWEIDLRPAHEKW
ncbi:NAD(P)-binding protein [Leucogyrophana mollusca]|uniref:NAD(P)-binding protein n=1 Tax=Leucogyrophana mollusca TaxID=85980 RepID=A0ACB8B3P6_9AGAM|nr:NAD(P)-binding protein [Leucogyrophana mollusca]